MDKAIEHNTKVFLLSVDLQKPYDSIPGVIIDLVRALHDNMVAEFLWLMSLHGSKYQMD